MKTNKKILAGLGLFATAVMWGWSFPYGKRLLEFVDPIFMTGTTFLAAGIVFLFWCLAKKKHLRFRLREGVVLGLLLGFYEIAQTTGLSETTAANTAFISGLGVLFIPIFERLFLKKKVPRIVWYGLLASVIGLYLLTGGVAGIGIGEMWLLIAAFGIAWYYIASNFFEKEKKADIYVLCAQQFLVVGAFFTFLAMMSGSFELNHFQEYGWELLLLSLFAVLVPYFLIQFGEEHLNSFQVTFLSSLEPFMGGLMAWTYGAEPFTSLMVVGGLTMACASLITETAPAVRRHLKRDRYVFFRRLTLVALTVTVSIWYAWFLLAPDSPTLSLFPYL